MAIFKTKSVTVDAIQFTGDNYTEVALWMGKPTQINETTFRFNLKLSRPGNYMVGNLELGEELPSGKGTQYDVCYVTPQSVTLPQPDGMATAAMRGDWIVKEEGNPYFKRYTPCLFGGLYEHVNEP